MEWTPNKNQHRKLTLEKKILTPLRWERNPQPVLYHPVLYQSVLYRPVLYLPVVYQPVLYQPVLYQPVVYN